MPNNPEVGGFYRERGNQVTTWKVLEVDGAAVKAEVITGVKSGEVHTMTAAEFRRRFERVNA